MNYSALEINQHNKALVQKLRETGSLTREEFEQILPHKDRNIYIAVPGLHGKSCGLVFGITPKGKRGWFFRAKVNGREVSYKICKFEDLSIAAARARVKNIADYMERGMIYQEKVVVTADTKIPECLKHMLLKLYKDEPEKFSRDAGLFIKHFPVDFLDYTLGQFAPSDLASFVTKMQEKGCSSHIIRKVKGLLAKIYNFAIRYCGVALVNPAKQQLNDLPEEPVTHRPHLEGSVAIREFLTKIDGLPQRLKRDFMIFMLMTGVRVGTAVSAKFEDFHFAEKSTSPLLNFWLITADDMKMQQDFKVFCSTQVQALVKGLMDYHGRKTGWLFPSSRHEGKHITRKTGVRIIRKLGYRSEELCAHGLRGTMSTYLNEHSYADLNYRDNDKIIELILDHRKNRSKTEKSYNHSKKEVRQAQMWQLWANSLDRIRAGNAPDDIHDIHLVGMAV